MSKRNFGFPRQPGEELRVASVTLRVGDPDSSDADVRRVRYEYSDAGDLEFIDDQDIDLFHELSHAGPRDDGKTYDTNDDPYTNAHQIEGLMTTDKHGWTPYINDKRDADKKCKRKAK